MSPIKVVVAKALFHFKYLPLERRDFEWHI